MRRASTTEDLRSRLAQFHTSEGLAAVNTLEVRADDVFIAAYSKSGTTWMQQVVHQLRSRANTDFDEIMEVVPFLEVAIDAGVDPHADQRWTPRAFKSHLMWRDIPKGARYITVFRDPRTVLTSLYRFFEGWWFEPGTISLDEFACDIYLGGTASGQHWDHLVGWWPRVGDDDVLALCYEDMLAAPDAVPAVVACFLGITLDDARMGRVIKHCSREYMTANARQFDEHLLRTRRDAAWGLPSDGESSKVTRGAYLTLSDAVVDALAARWRETVDAELGFADYQAFRAALPNPLGVER